MTASQNGWKANDRSVISTRTVPGTEVRLAVRNGAPGDLLLEVAARYHREVEPLVPGTCWGYAERLIRGSSTTVSNHASGTAIDVNAPQHPLATSAAATFDAREIAAVRRIVDSTRGVVRWGGDYDQPSRGGRADSRPDPMHFEINDGRTEAQCQAALDALRGSGVPPAAASSSSSSAILRVGSRGPAVKRLQEVLRAWYGLPASFVDSIFGPATEAQVRRVQKHTPGLLEDGIAGPRTLRALGIA